MKIMVTGSAGMVGQRVCDEVEARGHQLVALKRQDLDVASADDCLRVLESHRPEAVINCAAWTDVDGAESNEDAAMQVNGVGAGNLAAAAAAVGARIVHISTDYVFSGEANDPYLEASAVAEVPESAYGRTKLRGEREVAAANQNHLICRTAWVFGSGGSNFVDTMRSLAQTNESLNVVSDQVGSPTWTGHLAPALVEAAESSATGIAHLAGDGQVSWHGLAKYVFQAIGSTTVASPVTSEAFPRPAKRPSWSVLGVARDDTPRLPEWQQGVDAHLAEDLLRS